MKKVKFEKEILSKYLDFFNYTLDRIINEISTDKTKSEKKESIKLDLRNGEVEFRILKKISKQFKINVYNFFISEFGVNDFILDFKTKNRNHPLSIDTHYILNYYQNLREDIAYLSETSEKVKRRRVNVNESPKKIAK
ncbi:MAG: hypothetical protein OXU73_01890, partial [Candidatus Campbellbacteria bacterium]|nr:hypothetical protein [Candidatus Campbellbacteria bacterium]